jgi:aromatic-amino-acid transaminase
VYGQIQQTVRKMYSSPPDHGARLVARVLGTPGLRTRWLGELEAMRLRLIEMRRSLHEVLATQHLDVPLDRFTRQRGMFTYTGLSVEQVVRLREVHGVYLLESGRLCVAGLNTRNVEYTARALAAVMR